MLTTIILVHECYADKIYKKTNLTNFQTGWHAPSVPVLNPPFVKLEIMHDLWLAKGSLKIHNYLHNL